MTIHADEPVFTLRLRQEGDSWALVDSTDRVRATSPNKDLLVDNVPQIADACIKSAQMVSNHARVGQAIVGSCSWVFRP